MRYFISTLIIVAAQSVSAYCQKVDTLVEVGGYKLHFTILTGKGTPILFEAGGGNDGTVWEGITKSIADITNAPIILYDRRGLGKSSKDSINNCIENEIKGLKTGLTKLGFRQNIMLVSHSLGGFYNTLYASQNPKGVQAIVFIDANLPCFFTAEHLLKMGASADFRKMIKTIQENPLPATIPVIDIVSEKTLFEGTPDADRWKICHEEFLLGSPKRKGLTAFETGHYIFFSNRQLVINAIVTQYANYVMPANKAEIMERGYAQELLAANDDRRSLMKYWHSENDLNEWGYSFLNKKQDLMALEIFKLNVLLHPESSNAYDSLGEMYLKLENKELAILNYKKALELEPNKKSAKKALEELLK